MVALNPASSSYGCVPVSKLRPSGLVGAGRALYGRHCPSTSARPQATPRCGPQNL